MAKVEPYHNLCFIYIMNALRSLEQGFILKLKLILNRSRILAVLLATLNILCGHFSDSLGRILLLIVWCLFYDRNACLEKPFEIQNGFYNTHYSQQSKCKNWDSVLANQYAETWMKNYYGACSDKKIMIMTITIYKVDTNRSTRTPFTGPLILGRIPGELRQT